MDEFLVDFINQVLLYGGFVYRFSEIDAFFKPQFVLKEVKRLSGFAQVNQHVEHQLNRSRGYAVFVKETLVDFAQPFAGLDFLGQYLFIMGTE